MFVSWQWHHHIMLAMCSDGDPAIWIGPRLLHPNQCPCMSCGLYACSVASGSGILPRRAASMQRDQVHKLNMLLRHNVLCIRRAAVGGGCGEGREQHGGSSRSQTICEPVWV